MAELIGSLSVTCLDSRQEAGKTNLSQRKLADPADLTNTNYRNLEQWLTSPGGTADHHLIDTKLIDSSIFTQFVQSSEFDCAVKYGLMSDHRYRGYRHTEPPPFTFIHENTCRGGAVHRTDRSSDRPVTAVREEM